MALLRLPTWLRNLVKDIVANIRGTTSKQVQTQTWKQANASAVLMSPRFPAHPPIDLRGPEPQRSFPDELITPTSAQIDKKGNQILLKFPCVPQKAVYKQALEPHTPVDQTQREGSLFLEHSHPSSLQNSPLLHNGQELTIPHKPNQTGVRYEGRLRTQNIRKYDSEDQDPIQRIGRLKRIEPSRPESVTIPADQLPMITPTHRAKGSLVKEPQLRDLYVVSNIKTEINV
ncbi:hypothetical protein TWF102_006956 [Orbilia oligospora]|uniref:Uncharacterized protein n=1 Tax=Orbilia oligospora TaxID=2813651 RepID=A0A7C8NX48_ORBOL|nr:hypothetical protein TWF103_005829 [Orbilia oligospora]KAF3111283.1 hypothetical protein TWF102_006956 [Orbilia oligospora]